MADDLVDIEDRVAKLRKRAAERCNIEEDECHIGHICLQAMLDEPDRLHQIDTATGASETNLSVARRTCRLATAMIHYGIKPGDSVVIMSVHHLDACIPYFACHFGGFSVCTIDPSIAPEDLNRLFPFIHPKMVFCQKSCEEKVKKAFKLNRLIGEIVMFDDKTADMDALVRNYSGSHVNFRPPVIDQTKINAWLILTSGTTGCPKVATFPFKRILDGMVMWWSPYQSKTDRALTMSSLQWLSALIYYTCTPLRGYTRLQSSVPLTPDSLVALINLYRPNVTAWTPFALSKFLAMSDKVICDLSCFKYIAIGGSAIEKSLLDQMKAKCSAYLYLVYGMSELLVPVFEYSNDTPFGSAGKPFSRFQYKLMDENNQEVKQRTGSGELWIKSDSFCTGYLNNPEETATILTGDGWFKTGDIFYRDKNNYYFFAERKRLIIKHFGYPISPLQMEEIIKRHPGVADACVVAVPDPDCLEKPVAAIVRRNGDKVDPQEIFALLKANMPANKKLAGGLFFVDAFPVTPSGKVHRSKVRDMASTAKAIPLNE